MKPKHAKRKGRALAVVNAGGRPRKLTADATTLRKIANLSKSMCTIEEIAGGLDVAKRTMMYFLKSNPSAREAVERGQLAGKPSLRAGMFRLAKKSATMAIFLAVNYLGLENRYSGKPAGPITQEEGALSGSELLNRRIAQLRAAIEDELHAAELERNGPGPIVEGVALPRLVRVHKWLFS
jgi:hypothetical protein